MTAKVGMRSTIGLGLKEIWHKHKAATVLVLAILAVLALLVTYRGFRHMITLKNPEIDGFLNPTLVKAMIAGLGIGGLSLIGGLYFAHKLGKRTPTIVGLLIAELREKLEESRQKESKLSAPIANANNAPAIKTEESAPLSQPAKVDEGEGEAEIQQLTQQLSTQKQTTITLQNKLKKLLDFVEEMKQALQSRNDAFSHILPREDGANHPEASTSNPEDGSKDVQNVNRDPWAGTREEDARTLRTLRSDLTEAQAAKNELEDLKKNPSGNLTREAIEASQNRLSQKIATLEVQIEAFTDAKSPNAQSKRGISTLQTQPIVPVVDNEPLLEVKSAEKEDVSITSPEKKKRSWKELLRGPASPEELNKEKTRARDKADAAWDDFEKACKENAAPKVKAKLLKKAEKLTQEFHLKKGTCSYLTPDELKELNAKRAKDNKAPIEANVVNGFAKPEQRELFAAWKALYSGIQKRKELKAKGYVDAQINDFDDDNVLDALWDRYRKAESALESAKQ